VGLPKTLRLWYDNIECESLRRKTGGGNA
jgi:hypothetical protein